MNEFKIQGWRSRVDNGTSLCASCRGGHVVKGVRFGDDRTFCRAVQPNREITFRVTECSAYDDASMPSRWDLEQVAWELTTSPSRKIGFLSPQERAARNIPLQPPSR